MEKPLPIPKGLLETLEYRGIDCAYPLDYALADMSNEGELRYIYLLLTEKQLILAVSAVNTEMAFAGVSVKPRVMSEKDLGDVIALAVEDLSDPKIINEVVGGLLVVSVQGEETWLCRFSGARMREMRRFTDRLERLLKPDEEHPAIPEIREEEFCPKCGMPYPERGRAVCPRCMEKRTVMMRILSYFKEYRARVVIMLVCIAASGILNAIWPYLSGTVLYDKVLGRDEAFVKTIGAGGNFLMALVMLTLTMLVTKILQQVTGIMHGRMTAYMVPGVVCKIKNSVFTALQRLSIGFFTRRQTGSLMQRVNGDANQVLHFFIDGLPYLLFNVLTIVATAVIMFYMDWRLALVSLFLLPPLFYISYKLLPRLWHAHGRRARVVRSLYSVLNDNITGARVVRAFGQEESEEDRFDKANNRMRDAEIRVIRYENLFNAGYTAGQEIPVLLVWCVGALLILAAPDGFTYGKLLSFVSYLSMMQGPMDFFSHVFQWWSESMNAAQRVFEIIDARPDVVEKPSAIHKELVGNIEFRHVSFGYEPNKSVLQDITFSVRAGEMLGIVGKSGAGKSTLVNLLSRLYDAESGEILLEGVNVKDLAFSSLRGAVAMVSQETYIFMGTVADNIAYACPDAPREKIVRAAMAASAHSFICRLPDGYDTIIGAGGRQLSGGERQRLSIARAILADPRILVLDEATASVDTETEKAIQASLDELVKGRTTISIAHRLSTLRNADHLIVLENGKLAESGTHAQLVKQKGVYYKLLQLQSRALAMRGVGD